MQFDKFTLKSQEALQAAQSIAEQNGHQEINPEHLLKALLDQPEGAVVAVLQKMGVSLPALQADMDGLLAQLPKVSGSGFGQVYASQKFKKVLDFPSHSG
jgi:ATP-dependent Clp protease ATP-binding subunit ClpB